MQPRADRPARLGRIACWALLTSLVLSGCRDGESALARGDRYWADGNYSAALAEYRLSLRHLENDNEVLARVAHAFAQTAQLDRTREHYDRLLQRAPHYTDQAIFDYLMLARRSQERGDRHGMAGAVDAALALRPALPLDDMAAPLARYWAATGDAERALDFFERALAYAPADSVPPLLFELAEAHIRRGDCAEALGFLNAFRARSPRGPRADQARWHTGNCSFELGRDARAAGQYELALGFLRVTIELDSPRNLVDQAWFERGEALAALDRRDEALSAFYRVLDLNRGQLAQRARQRIDELRFQPAGWVP
jgi:tetratricopeptide (TPR) repeat protein